MKHMLEKIYKFLLHIDRKRYRIVESEYESQFFIQRKCGFCCSLTNHKSNHQTVYYPSVFLASRPVKEWVERNKRVRNKKLAMFNKKVVAEF